MDEYEREERQCERKKRRDNVRGPWIIIRSCLESMPSKSGMSIQQYPSHPF